MSSIRPLWLLVVCAVSGVLGWLGALLAARSGLVAPVLVASSVVTLAAVAVLVLALGIRVQRDKRRPPAARMDPVAAARTLVLAQSGAYAGALIAGWHAGVLVHLASATGFGTATVNDALVMIIGGLVLVIVGFVVEQFCRLPPDDGADGTANGSGGDPDGTRRTQGPAYGTEGEGGYARSTGR
ncbi:DUF3180 domain-containing protein [Citricoccus sp. SGAir0253]|uniref:DUF3180 domain-containing protein n=1 Tax=Citricoccus sp. SGAir0253 TaxID=2567881 RepID=UPI0010CD3FE4|nr:DUF3180 domain-containing protein [Citricoccus sp. SGAir0253]QCU76849.1 DUF3180 domain-containing protein [Citricoccus sp. SGAir0253]